MTINGQPRLRSLYRRLLRELPPSTHSTATSATPRPTLLSHRSPIHNLIRSQFASYQTPNTSSSSVPAPTDTDMVKLQQRLATTEQLAQYLGAQRRYLTLLERYNPGANMGQEERVRLSARRVGMNLPKEFK